MEGKIYSPVGNLANWAKKRIKKETRNAWHSLAYSPLGAIESPA